MTGPGSSSPWTTTSCWPMRRLPGLIGQGEPLSAGDLRRLCCDADLLPAVLGGPSTVLDVGRDNRLVTPELRAALVLRDGGCVFPGCNARPSECEAHHIIPWWRGGVTALWNLVLVVPPPPRAGRTRPVQRPGPVGDPDRPRRHPRNHPAPTLRPQPATPAPRPTPDRPGSRNSPRPTGRPTRRLRPDDGPPAGMVAEPDEARPAALRDASFVPHEAPQGPSRRTFVRHALPNGP